MSFSFDSNFQYLYNNYMIPSISYLLIYHQKMNNSLSTRLIRHPNQQNQLLEDLSFPVLAEQLPQRKSLYLENRTPISPDQIRENRKTCRIHEEEKASYFLNNEPWIKLCKECAFNKALCGYQIEKQYSQAEFQKKIVLSALVQEIKNAIEIGEKQLHFIRNISDIVNFEYQQNLSESIKSVDELMNIIQKTREEINTLYEQHIEKRIRQLYEKQDELKSNIGRLKKQLQNIQSSFCDLILDNGDGSEQFDRMMNLVREQIKTVNSRFLLQHQKEGMKQSKNKIIKLFSERLAFLGQQKPFLQNLFEKYCSENLESQPRKRMRGNECRKRETFSSERDTFTTRRQIKSMIQRINPSIHSNKENSKEGNRYKNLSLKNHKKPSNPTPTKMKNERKSEGLKQFTLSIMNSAKDRQKFSY